MKRYTNTMMVGLLLFVGATAKAASTHSPFLGDTSKFKKTKEMPDTRFYRHKTKKGTDYDKFLIEPVVFVQSKNSRFEELPQEKRDQLSELFQDVVIDAIAEDFTVVDQPGDGILKVRFGIVGLRKGRYYMDGMGSHQVEPKTRSLAATFEMETLDSMTGERIGAMVHEIKDADFDKRSREETLQAAKVVFTDWINRLKVFFSSEKLSASVPVK